MGFDLACDWKAGFVMDPAKKQRVGYMFHMNGLGMTDFLKPDIDVFTPYNSAAAPAYANAKVTNSKVTVVGLIAHFSFAGGVGDPICISAYISAENQAQLKGKLQTTLASTIIKQISWWIVNFDEEVKVWFEEAYPKDPAILAAQVNAANKTDIRLHVSDEPTKIAANIDVNVYNMYIEIVPAANSTYALQFASSSKTPYVRNWGLKVGTNAAAAMGA